MSKLICYCNKVSEQEIKDAIVKAAKTLKDIQTMTKACTGGNCAELNPSGKCCSADIKTLLRIEK